MGASVSIGSHVGTVALLIVALVAIVAICLLFYGSIIAMSGSARNRGIGLLCGLSIMVAGCCLIAFAHEDYFNSKPIRQFGASAMCLGLLVYATSFVLYIKKYR